MRAILILDDTSNEKLSRILIENDILFDLDPSADELGTLASDLDENWESSWESSTMDC